MNPLADYEAIAIRRVLDAGAPEAIILDRQGDPAIVASTRAKVTSLLMLRAAEFSSVDYAIVTMLAKDARDEGALAWLIVFDADGIMAGPLRRVAPAN